MSKVPLKQYEWHLSADKQEKRRLVNKKRRKRLKQLNKQAKTLSEVLDEAIKDVKGVKDGLDG
jgi:hypothetical protein